MPTAASADPFLAPPLPPAADPLAAEVLAAVRQPDRFVAETRAPGVVRFRYRSDLATARNSEACAFADLMEAVGRFPQRLSSTLWLDRRGNYVEVREGRGEDQHDEECTCDACFHEPDAAEALEAGMAFGEVA